MNIIRNRNEATHPAGMNPRGIAFTLIEIMVVMSLLSVIILGLVAMFNQTQKAFRAGMAQTDQLEGGRMFTDLLARDLQQMVPTYQTNALNFYAQIPAYTPMQMVLPASAATRTSILQNLFFMTRFNQNWNGIGYFVRTNGWVGSGMSSVGTLYRFETNIPAYQFNGNGYLAYQTFLNATNPANLSKILDGIVEFRVHCYDPNGLILTNGSDSISNNYFVTISNSFVIAPGQVDFYGFSNNIIPAYVELEVGVLEPAVLKSYRAIPDPVAQGNFLVNHAGNVQIFRQRVAIRNVDPSAYNSSP